ncbi:low temperature requirement protein A [Streptomyces sp. NPDC003863]
MRAVSAFWTAWMCFVTYGKVAAEKTYTRTVLVDMFGPAVMAVAVPEVRTEHASAFALAHVLVRLPASRVAGAWRGPGGLTEGPALGGRRAVDCLAVGRGTHPVLTVGGRAARRPRAHLRPSRKPRRIGSGPPRGEDATEPGGRAEAPRLPVIAHVDPRRLDERPGLFTLIVLGEGIAQDDGGRFGGRVDERLPSGSHRLMRGSLEVFLPVELLAGTLSGRGIRWIALVGVPMVAAPLLLAAFAGEGPPGAPVRMLFLTT